MRDIVGKISPGKLVQNTIVLICSAAVFFVSDIGIQEGRAPLQPCCKPVSIFSVIYIIHAADVVHIGR